MTLFWNHAMILIPFFSRMNISLLSDELPQNIISYVMTDWKYEKYTLLDSS